jgi:type IV pilus assembly protein PilW
MRGFCPESTTSPHLGLTLVELLITLALSLILLAGLIPLLVASQTSYQLHQALAQIQETARYAASTLSRDIRMAGFRGCASRHIAYSNHLANPPAAFTPERGIAGWEAEDSAPGSYTLASHRPVTDASLSGWATSQSDTPILNPNTFAVAQSDILRIWHTTGNRVSGTLPGTQLQTAQTPSYATHDALLLSDCQTAALVLACNVSGKTTELACAANASRPATSPADGWQIWQAAGWLYYVGKRSRQATHPPTLYRRMISKYATAETAQELAEGVESLQIRYGEDTNGDHLVDQTVTADQVSDWQSVLNVQIDLLVRSLNPVLATDEPQQLTFNGVDLTAQDGYLRYPFSLSITLRNRIP